MFADEIKKHDAYLGYIRQNLSAQDNILTAVTEANVNYARVKKIVEAHQSKYEIKPLAEMNMNRSYALLFLLLVFIGSGY